MSRAREVLMVVVVLGGAGLMFEGERVRNWLTGWPSSDDEMLINAVAGGDLNAVRRAVAAGAAVNGTPACCMSPLEMAASAGDECLVAFLIGHGADVNRLGPAGFTPLCYVITISGHEGVVRLLLEAGADPDGRCGSVLAKVPPLVSAVMAGREEVVELLLKAGADPNLSGSGGSNHFSPLTAAAATDDPVNERIVKMLLRSGADMTRPDGDGITPLHAADRGRHPELAVSPRSAKDAG